LKDIEELEKKGDCAELIKQRIALTCNLLYTNENFTLLLDTVEALCQDTCLNGKKCTDPDAKDPYSLFRTELAALAYFRFGEIENCVGGHTHESCLFPLQGTAIHRKKYGSENAIPYLLSQLHKNPDNEGAKWSLNLAYMTLGKYPQEVPEMYLLEPSLFASDYEVNPFVNVAGALGVDTHSPMGTTIFEDFNGDNWLDIFHVAATYDPQVRYYINDGKGGFVDGTVSGDLIGITGGANAKQGDFDNDGFIDVYIVRGGWTNVDHPNSLLRNLGNGTWEDVTFRAFPTISLEASHGCDWGDINNDGLLDLFVSNENNNCELWINNGDGTFYDIGRETGTRYCGLSKTVGFGDFNNDGWVDLFISRSGFPNLLWRNNGKPLKGSGNSAKHGWSFTEIGKKAGVTKPYLSFPFAWFDVNQDGYLDLFTTGHILEGPSAIASSYTGRDYFLKKYIDNVWGFGNPRDSKTPHVYLNNHDETFTDITDQTGRLADMILGMALNFGDIDNDGFEDVYVGTGQIDLRALLPNRLWRNTGTNLFQDITTSARVGHLQKGHGATLGDFDNDGDMDILSNIGGAWKSDTFRNALFLNPGQKWTNYLKVKLRGSQTNSYALGARVTLTLEENGKERKLYRFISTGGSYGANPFEAHFGLRDASAITGLEIYWPRSGVQKFNKENLPAMNTFIIVPEHKPWVLINNPSIHYNVEELLKKDEVADHHCECFIQ